MSRKLVFTDTYQFYRGDRGVNIMRKPPVWGDYYKAIPIVYPTWPMIMSIKNNKGYLLQEAIRDYTKEYIQMLENVGFQAIDAQLDNGDVLLCNCAKGKFCHRLLLGEWLKTKGLDVIHL